MNSILFCLSFIVFCIRDLLLNVPLAFFSISFGISYNLCVLLNACLHLVQWYARSVSILSFMITFLYAFLGEAYASILSPFNLLDFIPILDSSDHIGMTNFLLWNFS